MKRKNKYKIFDEDTFEKIEGKNVIDIKRKVAWKIFPGLNTTISCFFNDIIGKKGRALNILYNFANNIQGNNPDAEGSLQSQCGKTTQVMNMLFEESKLYPSIFPDKKKSFTYYASEHIDNHSEFLEMTGDIFETLDNLKNENGKIYYTNIEIQVPCLGFFPGHAFNIIISSDINNYKCRNIYVIQSFIYAYNLKVFWTNDIDDLSEFIAKYMDLFLEPYNLVFTGEDDEIAKQIFGTPLLDLFGNTLVGKEKPEEILVNVFPPVTINDLRYKMDLFIGKVNNVYKKEKEKGRVSFYEYLDKHIYLTPYYLSRIVKEEKLIEYISYLNDIKQILDNDDCDMESLGDFELLTYHGIIETREPTRSSQFSQKESEDE